MSHVLVTGAHGFVGQRLVSHLLSNGLGGRAVTRVTATDLHFQDSSGTDERLHPHAGDIADPAFRRGLLGTSVDAVFHLACVPGGAAERDYALGRRVNLDATLGLIEDLRSLGTRPRFVYASAIALYGPDMPARVGVDTLPAPALTYAAHKLIGEILVADATRRGWIEGCSLRLPGVVARPGDGSGLMSAYMNRVFWCMAAGEPLVAPVSEHGKSWWLSVRTCVENLVHAATVDLPPDDTRRVYQVPALRLSMGEVVDALAARFGQERRSLVQYRPDPNIDRLFAAFPDLDCAAATAAGFRDDGDAGRLVDNALA
jgi:nucleoside-diphosphate-sugar epimerase